MTRLFGFFLRTATDPATSSRLEAIGRARLGAPVYMDGTAMLWGPVPPRSRAPFPLTILSDGTVHNRRELGSELGLACSLPSDAELLHEAFARWGEQAYKRIHGDWRIVGWNPAARTLSLARDPFGNTALYHHAAPGVFAFASSREDLLALDLAPVAMDELYVAQTLVSWFAYHGERTVHASISRLPPAHSLRVTPDRFDKHCYWRLEDVADTRLPRREDYVVRFRELFDQAVRDRLPSEGGVAATLSGGLDSGSVAVTAAPMLAEDGRRLSAYVSTPIHDPRAYVGRGIGDEYPLASATARAGGTIDLTRIDAANVSPIGAIREMLAITREPEHAAPGFFWLLDLFRTAARDGNRLLLLGQMGNGGISWDGDPTSLPLWRQIERDGLAEMAKLRLRRLLPWPMERLYRRLRARPDYPSTAIRTDFAHRIRLGERWRDDRAEGPYRRCREQRLRFIRPGALKVGALYAEVGAATGISITDPTADPRLLEFCLSIPDSLYVDPQTGVERWLVREAMKGRLPDEVRLNRSIGRQSGDLVPRLRQFAGDVEEALAEVARGPGAEYVDVARMRRVWQQVQVEDNGQALNLAGTVLTRGLMAGLFVNGFGTRY
ncbi:asparagine synthase-related protein [Sphingomonas sp. QA11]|uniref:asparagine synthetase B family protein n=1 Tax=Sphingomonas sp. QA11 TaxID=2950605 RepID=UPI002349CBF3|nr:asparagine synthase-related protein [Sphingomonas sp. QA11]WCM28010.1 asparagine synthase-related protein [Sphingomonas sp. QA11]